MITLTQNSIPVIGDVARLLGKIMNALFLAMDSVGYANIGLAIIAFTVVVKLLMLPLTVKQQKFSKLTSVMNPELQAITKKYKGKKDQDTMLKMQAEQKAVYEKYGTSPTGGCLQMFIQLPIILALYQVVQKIPAYVPSIKTLYSDILSGTGGTSGIMSDPNFAQTMSDNFTIKGASYANLNSSIDAMAKFGADNWHKLAELYPNAAELITANSDKIDHMNNFLGINMSQNPGFAIGLPLLIPILAGLSQWVSTKLIQTTQPGMDDDNPTAASMKMMTNTMPLMTVVFGVTLPAGIGIYWIAQAVVQIIIQLAVNKYLDKVGIDALIKKNLEKQEKKKEKNKTAQTISSNAKQSTKAQAKETAPSSKVDTLMKKKEEQDKKVKEIMERKNSMTAKPGSMADKAGLVSKYNEKNKK